ncbi:uncharacterized protein PV06_11682 [Exophiala oligosperma]|uniref:Xaa-Pro dipeptidyl-peptidase-like domain-containing protein n=1 Tax=Exophiala oligosperma TaxID=215243 RepID=A0A0D2BEW8_9EURO|nr:uncharacterized protein PV06_11682 [Exophiala oligosperma]KIW36007.1 hypothetical protein PV06_11682 [Exophiala oligosperma]
MASASRRNISFKTVDQLTLRGWFYPAGDKSPVVILSHGLTGLKEQYLDDFAARFQAAGFASLVYDNRNFGASDGHPRFEVDGFKQVEDYHDAITYVSTLSEVSADRIAIWGSSYSGGNVLQAAAVDRRIKAVIAQVPFVAGSSVPGLLDLMPLIIADRSRISEGAPGALMTVVADTLTDAQAGTAACVLPAEDAYRFFMQSETGPNAQWENKITLQSLFKLMKNEPRAYIERISPTPLFMVIAEDDTAVYVPTQMETFERAKEPKELLFLKGTGHFEPYSGDCFETNIEAQLKFLRTHLKD